MSNAWVVRQQHHAGRTKEITDERLRERPTLQIAAIRALPLLEIGVERLVSQPMLEFPIPEECELSAIQRVPPNSRAAHSGQNGCSSPRPSDL